MAKMNLFPRPPQSHFVLLSQTGLALALLLTPLQAIVPAQLDVDSDGLADTWEIKHFDGLSHADGDPTDDPDGDGKNNLNESVANTDPNDPDDCFVMVDIEIGPNSAIFTWDTSFAKKYNLEVTEDLQSWDVLEGGVSGSPLDFRGTGEELTVDFSDPANAIVTNAVTRHLWFGLSDIPSDLDAHFSTLIAGDPDGAGTEWFPRLQLPEDDGEAYSARFTGYLTPEVGGSYTFVISSRGPGKFRVYTDDTPTTVLAECSVDQNEIMEPESVVDASQTSAAVTLVAGTRYFIEATHVHDTGLDHFGVAWSGPVPVEVIPSKCFSPVEDFTSANASALLADSGASKFARSAVQGSLGGNDFDADGDGIDDATESDPDLKTFGFDPYNVNGTGNGVGNDGDTLADLLQFDPATDKEAVAALTLDAQSIELLDPPLLAGNILDLGSLGSQSGPSTDKIRFRISRSEGLHPVTITYAMGGATVSDGTQASATEGVDFTAIEVLGGAPADGTVTIPAGVASVEIEVTTEKDDTHEYPETVSCTIIPGSPDYDPAPGAAQAKAEIVDMAGDVNILFVGAYQEDFNATPGSNSTNGSVSGYLRGDKRTFILRNDNFGNLSAPQSDTHFHKVIDANTGTPPIHDIISSPGVALLGHYLTYDWDLTNTATVTPIPGPGAPSRQTIIDSLFNQSGQTKLYINLHTDNNTGGEAMAILEPATGSIDPPAAPPTPPAPGDAGLELLAGADLEREIVRFLNQATFGAAWEEVQAIKLAIENERLSTPAYHRIEEFEKWIEEQCKLDQTYLLDYNLAADFRDFNLRGIWDPFEWNDWTEDSPGGHNEGVAGLGDGDPDVEAVPTSWPFIDRSLTDGAAPGLPAPDIVGHPHFMGNQWYPSGRYPTDSDWVSWMDDTTNTAKVGRNLGNAGPRDRNRRRGHWNLMVNGKDQLRQKWGYAIQQIVVVSDNLGAIETRSYAASNYQDMLSFYGLPSDRDANGTLDADEQVYYRDILGWANWSPVMGYWLSSLKNRAAYDSDGDTIIDIYPDENLAREDMQLFSIGLFNLWLDGSLQLQSGANPNIPPGSSSTYTNDDIQEFARVLTGQSFSRRTYNNRSATVDGWDSLGQREGPYGWGIESTGPFPDAGDVFDTINDHGDGDQQDGDDGINYNTSFTWGNGDRWVGHAWNYPMRMFGYQTLGGVRVPYHDLGVKTIVGGRVIDNTSLLVPESGSYTSASMIAMGVADIEDAMNWLAGKVDGDTSSDFSGEAGTASSSHASTPPFISRRLIQRMVTSNPSSAYLYRVSEAFKNSEGNMLEVCKAVLLDYEARSLRLVDGYDSNSDGDFIDAGESAPTITAGMKKSPMEAYMQLLRAFEAHSLLPIVEDPSLPPFSLPPHNGAWPVAAGGYDPGTYPTSPFSDPQEVIYMSEYGYPASQADNFRLNCLFQFPSTDDTLSMSPFAQESVFNFYLPDFTTGVVQTAALVAPELQLSTETEVVRNHNFFWDITWDWDTSRDNRNDGDDVEELGGSSRNQREAFGIPAPSDSGSDIDNHDKVRIDFERWAEALYNEGMVAASRRTANSLEAEDLVDKIDARLTGGDFKVRYPYDPSDDEDPLKDGFSPRAEFANDGNFINDKTDGRNPREWVIHAVADSYGDGVTAAERRDKFRLALYLLSQTPEYIIKK